MPDSSSNRFFPPSQTGSGSGHWVSPTTESERGRTIGHYRTVRELGRGSFGVVYLAQHMTQGHQVALKLLLNPRNKDELQRFFREGELASRLNHPGIVRVLDRGVHHDLPWLVMEYCPGTNLRERLLMGALSIPKACELVVQVAEALEVAHAQGVIHRDLKPANILLDSAGRPRITDFGLARQAGNSQLTRSGDGLGSPLYMPPEQFSDAKHVDERGDVYSLGLVLYEALTSQQPFEGSTVIELTEAIHSGTTVPLRVRRPEVPRWLAKVCERAFAHDAGERYSSVRAFREALLAGDPASRLAQPPAALRRPSLGPFPMHRPPEAGGVTTKVILAGVTVGLAVAAAVTVGVHLYLRQAVSSEAKDVARSWVAEGSLPEARSAYVHARTVGVQDPALNEAFKLLEGLVEAEAALERGATSAAREVVSQSAGDPSLTPWFDARRSRLLLLLRTQEAIADPTLTHALDDTIQDLLAADGVHEHRDRLARSVLEAAQQRSRERAALEDVLAWLSRAERVAHEPALIDAVRLEEASVHFRRGRFARATELARDLATRPGRLGLQAAYVAAYGKVWRDPLQGEGLEELHALWRRDPEGPVGLNAGAVWHSHQGKNAKGEQLALAALRLDPDYVDPYISLAFCCNDQFHVAKERSFLGRSLEASRKAAELMPDHPRAYLAQAYALGNLGNADAGLAAYEEVIALTEPRPMARALRSRAGILLSRGRAEEALEDLGRALERNPSSVDALLLRGLIYERAGRSSEAKRDWVQAYRADPQRFQAYLRRYTLEAQKRIWAAVRGGPQGQPRRD